MKKRMAVLLIASMTVATGAGSVAVSAAPQETKAESIKANADVLSTDLENKDIYYMGTGENNTTVILGATNDWSDYEAIITADDNMMIISSKDAEDQKKQEISDDMAQASVEVSSDKETVTITLPDGTKIKAERSELLKSIVDLSGAYNTFCSAVERKSIKGVKFYGSYAGSNSSGIFRCSSHEYKRACFCAGIQDIL